MHINTEKNNQVEYNERFIFLNGYAWTPEMEKLFEERCVNNPRCGYNFSKLDDIYKLYSKEYPDWKLKRYYTKAFRLLDHIYHCMRKYSAKEMLYKAGIHMEQKPFSCPHSHWRNPKLPFFSQMADISYSNGIKSEQP